MGETWTERAALESRIRSECVANGIPMPPDGPLEAQLRHLMDGRDAEVVALRAERDRLARVLAVERGDWREVPAGWEPRGADMWVRGTHPGRPVIQRWHRDGQPTEWLRRGQIDGPRWPTALEATEAIDAEVSDAPA